jgi:hypothetical protein
MDLYSMSKRQSTPEAIMAFSDGVHYGPSTQTLNDVFAAGVDSLGGSVSDRYQDDTRLFVRAILLTADDVSPGDTVRAGIAMRVAGPSISIHPYTLRRVCTNGAVMAQATRSVHVERIRHDGIVIPEYDVAVVAARVSEAMDACATREAFAQSIDDMREAMSSEVDIALQLLPLMDRLPRGAVQAALGLIFDQWFESDDQSAFGLMNAITAVARETPDPETRWTLEAIGGSLLARMRRSAGQPNPAAPLAGV